MKLGPALLLCVMLAACARSRTVAQSPAPVSTTPAPPSASPTFPAVASATPAASPGPAASALALPATCAASLAQLSSSPSDAQDMMPNLTSGALQQAIVDHNQLAYVVATAEWETGHFSTMHEYYNKADDLNEAYDGELGNAPYPSNDGYLFRGRGYVQLTGRDNYKRMGELLGIDLVSSAANAETAADRFIAGEIAAIGMARGLFTGVKLDDYIGPSAVQFVAARAIVNDHDKAATIATYATNFADTLIGCGAGILK